MAAIGLDDSDVAGDGRKSSVDNRTLFGTPAPLAASTVAKTGRKDDW